MSFLKELGGFAGGVFGFVVGKPIEVIGMLTDVEMIENIGTGVQKSSKFAGETLGQVTGGAVNTVRGIVGEDENLRNEGLGDMGQAIDKTAKGVVHTVKGVVSNGSSIVEGALSGDTELIKKGTAGIATTVAVGAIAFGVVEFAIDADAEAAATTEAPASLEGGAGVHHVEPHYVEGYTKADGTVIDGYWRDGDGDTSVDTYEGYMRSNPDGIESNNLG